MTKAKILVVDNKLTHRKYIGDVLQSKGYEVVEVGSTSEARQKLLGSEVFSLIFLDYMMPHQKGTDFLQEIRTSNELSRYRQIPAIIVTAYAEDEEVQAAVGPNVFVLSKPLRDYRDILDAVDQALNK